MPKAIDTRIFLTGILLIFAFTKVLTLLPDRFYFSFSSIVSSESQTQFLVRPNLPTPEVFCDAARAEEWTGIGVEYFDPKDLPAIRRACLELDGGRLDLRNWRIQSSATEGTTSLTSAAYRQATRNLILAIRANAEEIYKAIDNEGIAILWQLPSINDRDLEASLILYDSIPIALAKTLTDSPNDYFEQVRDGIFSNDEIRTAAEAWENAFEADQNSLRQQNSWNKLAASYRERKLSQPRQLIHDKILSTGKSPYPFAILLKLLPALLTGACLAVLFREESLISGPFSSGFAALLLCWPVIVLWDVVVSQSWQEKRLTFLFLYALYIISYYWMARLGVMLTLRTRLSKLSDAAASKVQWPEILSATLANILTSSLTTIVTWTFAKAG